ncbi:MAG: hypothetical protein RL750_105 [Bacteroidota bacterium]|jgi:hypothetical protein
MKNIAIALAISTLLSNLVHGQTSVSNPIRLQVDSLKSLYAADGFQLVKESPLQMESEYEIPVVLPLTQGTFYQFVFIGEPSSRLYEVRMFDWKERQIIFQQKRWGDVDGNIIAFSYIPPASEYHMMRPVQVNKKQKKNLTGYIMVFKKTK